MGLHNFNLLIGPHDILVSQSSFSPTIYFTIKDQGTSSVIHVSVLDLCIVLAVP